MPDKNLLPYLLLGGFAGIREAEIQRLAWSCVDLEERCIEIPGQISKTNKRRIVPIPDNLAAWLKPLVKGEGNVCPHSMMRAERKALCKTLKIDWPQNALRHSYGSYRLASCGDVGRVSLEMGNSPAMVMESYHKAVRQKVSCASRPPATARSNSPTPRTSRPN